MAPHLKIITKTCFNVPLVKTNLAKLKQLDDNANELHARLTVLKLEVDR